MNTARDIIIGIAVALAGGGFGGWLWTATERRRSAFIHRRNCRRHRALAPAAERFAPAVRSEPEFDHRYLQHITRIAATLPPRRHQLGRDLADRLRQGSPSAADAQIATIAMHLVFFIARARTEAEKQGRDPADTYDAVLDVLACAAVDLGALELAS